MWFLSLAECKEEVKCQVVYFCAIFLSQNNTEFAKSNLSLIIDRGIPLLGTLAFIEILWSGKRGVKSLLTILSKPKMSSETAALFSREIKKLFSFSSVHILPFLIIFSFFTLLYCRWKRKAETDKRTPRNSLFMFIIFHLWKWEKWCLNQQVVLYLHRIIFIVKYVIKVPCLKVEKPQVFIRYPRPDFKV